MTYDTRRSVYSVAYDIIPPRVRYEVLSSRKSEVDDYCETADDELLRVVRVCLKNLQMMDPPLDEVGPDFELRALLVPELSERFRPRMGLRDEFRRFHTTSAEYYGGGDNLFRLSLSTLQHLDNRAEDLRSRIAGVRVLSTFDLVDSVRFALGGCLASSRNSPSAPVYEPAFAYRVVPALASRVLCMVGGVTKDVVEVSL